MDIGSKLKKLRIDHNLTLDELSKIFNEKYNTKISKSVISKWENNKRVISNTNAIPYCKYFNVSLDYIFNTREALETLFEIDSKELINEDNIINLKKYIPLESEDIYYNQFPTNLDELVEFSEIGISRIRELIDILWKTTKLTFEDLISLADVEATDLTEIYTDKNKLLRISKYFGIMPYFELKVKFSENIEILKRQRELINKTNNFNIDEIEMIENTIDNLKKLKNK